VLKVESNRNKNTSLRLCDAKQTDRWLLFIDFFLVSRALILGKLQAINATNLLALLGIVLKI
jgi:hypothetical protein